MSEVQVVEQQNEVLVPLTEVEAKALDNKITSTLESIGDRLALVGRYVDEAEKGQIHRALGFPSWTAYVEDRMAGKWHLRGDDRRAMAQMLSRHGMSTRAIAAVTGSSPATAARDVSSPTVSFETEELADNSFRELAPAADDESSCTVSNETVDEQSEVIVSRDGSHRPRLPRKPKADAGQLVPRKVVEKIAPRLDGMVTALDGLDPNEVDGDTVREQVGTIRESIGKLTDFVDKVLPLPPTPPEPVDPDVGRKVQIPTALRAESKMLVLTIGLMRNLTSDPRWGKSVERLNHKDRVTMDACIGQLQQVRAAMGELYNTTTTDEVQSPPADEPPILEESA